jgi:hypothetical protein
MLSALEASTALDTEMNGISCGRHGAKVLRHEYKLKLDIDISSDLLCTEMFNKWIAGTDMGTSSGE